MSPADEFSRKFLVIAQPQFLVTVMAYYWTWMIAQPQF